MGERRATTAIVGAVVGGALVLGVLLVGGAVLFVKHAHNDPATSAAGLVTVGTRLTADRGAVVFADDFHDPGSGWNSGVLASGTSFGYAAGGYLIAGRGTLHHFAEAPFRVALDQLSVAATGTQTEGAPDGAGFGVTCWRGDGAGRVRYEFVLLAPSTWYLERDGGVDTLTDRGVVLRKGDARIAPGSKPITLVGVCASLDATSTRVALFVDGLKMVDQIDRAGGPGGGGWLSGLDVSSREAGDSAVTVVRFEDRDLSA